MDKLDAGQIYPFLFTLANLVIPVILEFSILKS
jgi:hypothetical protein